ncbi:P-loop NTPase [Streptomyces misionensis]
MGAVFHLLCFTPLVQRESALETVRSLHAEGERIDGILVLGCGAGEPRRITPDETGDFLETVLLECLEADNALPPVTIVPGRHDVGRLGPGHGMLAKALTRYWGDTERGLWRGDEQDIVEAVRDVPFADFGTWSGAHANFPGWHQGVLPGEGSVRLGTDAGTLGIVAVNTVFRTAVPDATAELVTCSPGQWDSAVGGDYLQWAGANGLTLVVAGHSAAVPPSLAPVLPKTVLLAPEGDSAPSGSAARWLVTSRGTTRQHRLLRVQTAGPGAPKVRDLAAPPAEQPVPLPSPRRAAHPARPAGRATPAAYDERAAMEEFYQQIGTGRMVLVAVSGVHGESDPVDTDRLTRQLTEAVYSGVVPDPAPTTAEIWNTALAELGSRAVGEFVAELRGADEESTTAARRILGAPWWRVYDFTATDVFSSLPDADPRIAETNTFVDALARKPAAGNATVETVAMHGNPTGPETLDFTVPADDDLSPRALWFRRLKAELLTHPTVFMAASPSSRSLWNALALAQPQTEAEHFPRFLITGPGTAADRARIRQAGLTHIQVSPHAFAVRQLRPGLEILQQGRRRLADIRVGARRGSGIKLVSSLVDSAPAGSVEFLKGQDPTWGDVKDGFAVKLSITDRIRASARPAEDGRRRIVLVEGRAGSGKTTALMQYAYELHQAGRTVAWIDREATDPLPNLKAQALSMSADAIFVDDVDIFGSLGASLLRELSNGGRALVVAAIRTTRSDELDVTFQSRRVSADEPLKDEDLGQIVDVLHEHGLPGILKRQNLRPEKIDKLRELCDRSLLVAMIQVVTGKRFEDKIASEYHELDPEQVSVYATVCVFESAIVFKKRGIEQEDLLQIVSGRGAPKPSLNRAINRLVDRRFLTLAPDGTVRSRQRTIADTVVDTVLKKNPDQLAGVIEYLLRFYAQYAADIRDNDDPYRRILIRLLNHSLMVSLRLRPTQVRDIYSTVHELLQDNFHYWLQRGEYELERGDLGIAENHLETAQGCEGGATDHFVLTAWSAIRLRRSTESPADGSLRERAFEAIGVLEEVTRRHGGASPHSFSVVARRGTEWVEACEVSLSVGQVDDTLRRILAVVEAGRRFCKDNHEFMRIADEFEPKVNRLLERSKGIPL